MINIKDIKTIDVLHTSFDSDGELVDNFAIVDTLLEHIEKLEAENKRLDENMWAAKYCNPTEDLRLARLRIKELEEEIEGIYEDQAGACI